MTRRKTRDLAEDASTTSKAYAENKLNKERKDRNALYVVPNFFIPTQP